MSINIKTTTKIEEAANFIFLSISNHLKSGKHVLFFVSGGSSIPLAVKVSELLRNYPHENLTITLSDERYGHIGHPDSNWHRLVERGFALKGAKLIPVLIGDDMPTTTFKFNEKIKKEFEIEKEKIYKIGLFGIGKNGHTSGILPGSAAVSCRDLVCGYDTPEFSRITLTPPAIGELDEAVVWAQGEDKWGVLKDLEKNIDVKKQPAQILKKVPLLTIFTDYRVE